MNTEGRKQGFKPRGKGGVWKGEDTWGARSSTSDKVHREKIASTSGRKGKINVNLIL